MSDLLKLTAPTMEGPTVKRLQEAASLLDIEPGPHDGVFGKLTEAAVLTIQSRCGIAVDGMCGPVTWGAIENELRDADATDRGEAPDVVDLRGTHEPPKLFERKRPWSTITGVTLHQTGCHMSSAPSRWKTLNAHLGITRDGRVIVVNDPTDLIWHAQRLSLSTIGIEICGNFPGIQDDPHTLWTPGGGPEALNSKMIHALDCAFDWITAAFHRNGQQWQYVHAHRQSSQYRRSDPGSEIWQSIGLPWLERTGGSDGGPDWKLGNGRPIPSAWNPQYTTEY